ncbi:TPA: hypothetical protein EYP44_05375 [Candidatus Bathyarchaeota archaeon]|nr:hypothetical protein [Candidatus Bathyarchaeota archaeon]
MYRYLAGERTLPIADSLPYLQAWMGIHPLKDDPDAPLRNAVSWEEARLKESLPVRERATDDPI